ncbi:hypothetical protein FNT36_06815 [Hymenobacter setariae]|uniref:Lipoprotein n=1 Tax=Hymenobacter setariae TaxID=2594794 RepID=A0A558BXB9_9BACT|nr:hypothetical protein [Hymenobacter setariae]TVT41166.1 hypothetical protein FNT36_06815 [Hymenobacter setariae]
MKLTTSPLPYLGLALGLLTGCGRDETPAPAAEATYSRTVTYSDTASPSRLDSTFKSPVIKTFVLQNPTYFTVFLQRQPDREAVTFSFLRAKLPANPVGTYSFKTRQDDTPDVSFAYQIEILDYRSSSTWGYHLYDKTIYSPTGSLTITAYDAERRLVSGRFEVTVPNAADPFALYSTSVPRRSNLSLQGTFTNAPVQDRE